MDNQEESSQHSPGLMGDLMRHFAVVCKHAMHVQYAFFVQCILFVANRVWIETSTERSTRSLLLVACSVFQRTFLSRGTSAIAACGPFLEVLKSTERSLIKHSTCLYEPTNKKCASLDV